MRVVVLSACGKFELPRSIVCADIADGSRTCWYSNGIRYSKSVRKARDWAAEKNFAAVWRPTGECVVRLSDSKHKIEADAEAPLPAREKRPRDCQEHSEAATAHLENRCGTREGASRPKGTSGTRMLQELCRPTKRRSTRGLLMRRSLRENSLLRCLKLRYRIVSCIDIPIETKI